MKKQATKTDTPVDRAHNRAKEVAESILSNLGLLTAHQNVTQDEDDQPGAYAREVIKMFREGVAKTAKDTEEKD